MRLSFIIPTLNSQKYIKKVIYKLIKYLKNNKFNFEIIIINDESKDKTKTIIENISEKNSRIKIINNKINIGQFSSIVKGLKISKGDYIFTLDDDLNIKLKSINRMINKIKKNNLDVVVGYSYKSNRPYLRKFARMTVNLINKIIFKTNVKGGSYRIIKIKIF